MSSRTRSADGSPTGSSKKRLRVRHPWFLATMLIFPTIFIALVMRGGHIDPTSRPIAFYGLLVTLVIAVGTPIIALLMMARYRRGGRRDD